MEKTHTITLTEQQLKLLDTFLTELGEHQSNASCNDLPKELESMFTPEEGQKVASEYAVYNNPEKPDGPPWPIPDGCLTYWLQRKIKDQIGTKPVAYVCVSGWEYGDPPDLEVLPLGTTREEAIVIFKRMSEGTGESPSLHEISSTGGPTKEIAWFSDGEYAEAGENVEEDE